MSQPWWRPGASQPEPRRQPQQEAQQEATGRPDLRSQFDPNRRVILHDFRDVSGGDPNGYGRGEAGVVLPAAIGVGESENTPTWEWIRDRKPVEVMSLPDGEDAFIEKLGVVRDLSESGRLQAAGFATAAPSSAQPAVRVEFEYEDGESVEAHYHGVDVQRRSICLYAHAQDTSSTRYTPRVGQPLSLRVQTPGNQQSLTLTVKHLGIRHDVGEYRCLVLFPCVEE